MSLAKTEVSRRMIASVSQKSILIAVLAIFTVTVWASAFPAIKMALSEYSPPQMACLRFLVALIVLLLCAGTKVARLPRRRDALHFLVCGALGLAVYNVALAYGELNVPAGTASLLVSTSPLFAAVLAHVFLRDRLAMRSWIGLLVSLVGAVVISSSQGVITKVDAGVAAILLAAVTQGLFVVAQKPLFARYSPVEVAVFTVSGASLSLIGFLPSTAAAIAKASLAATLSVVYLGAVPAALGILGWSYILARVSAAKAAGLLYVVPVASLVVSWLWLGEVPTPVCLIGGAMSIAGVALAAKNKRAQCSGTAGAPSRCPTPADIPSGRTWPGSPAVLQEPALLCAHSRRDYHPPGADPSSSQQSSSSRSSSRSRSASGQSGFSKSRESQSDCASPYRPRAQ